MNVLTALGTFGATVTAIILATWSWLSSKREILSGLAFEDLDPDGVAYLTNTTRQELRFSLYKNEDVVDCKKQDPSYRQLLEISKLRNGSWNPWKDGMVRIPTIVITCSDAS